VGKKVLTLIITTIFQQHRFVGNHLVNLYAMCQSIEDARKVFDKIPKQNVVSRIGITARCGLVDAFTHY
jgi:pentatricopeptide repeat protein